MQSQFLPCTIDRPEQKAHRHHRRRFLTVYPGTSPLPTASNLNWVAGTTIPNLVTVQTGADGTIRFHNGSGCTTQIIADTAGYDLS
jgi:hypothetical protein